MKNIFFSKIKRVNRGLTLVEILVVILIIGLLIAALIPRVSSSVDKAKETQIRTDFRTFSTAAESVMREYSGFSGVPMYYGDGTIIDTIGNKFWTKGGNIAEAAETPVTVSLIKAINRYLESSAHFSEDVGTVSEFGRSKAKDPWNQPYEIYFLARNGELSGKNQSLSSDRIYITSSGKTQNINYADYTLLVQYKAGEVRSATVGFEGESYLDDTDYLVVKDATGKQYIALNDLFENGTNGKDEIFTAAKSIFKLGGAGTIERLNYTKKGTGNASEAPNATVMPAVTPKATK